MVRSGLTRSTECPSPSGTHFARAGMSSSRLTVEWFREVICILYCYIWRDPCEFSGDSTFPYLIGQTCFVRFRTIGTKRVRNDLLGQANDIWQNSKARVPNRGESQSVSVYDINTSSCKASMQRAGPGSRTVCELYLSSLHYGGGS